MNLKDFRSWCRNRLGLPVAGDKGSAAFNAEVREAVKRLAADMPDILLRTQYQFKLELPFIAGTLSVDPNDPYVVSVEGLTTDQNTYLSNLDAGLVRGRTLEIYAPPNATNANTTTFTRVKIRDKGKWNDLAMSPPTLVMDRPWPNTTDTGMPYRILTEEYPVPANAREITRVVISPETTPGPLQRALDYERLTLMRQARGWRGQGRPMWFASGVWQQLPGLRSAPVATVLTGDPPAKKWGYPSGSLNTNCGPAGTFKYVCCVVWGRRPFPEALHAGAEGALFPGTSSVKAPRYISGASVETSAVTTTWGNGAIKLTSPDLDYVFGYNADPSKRSYRKSGLEKWWFRARVATEASTSSVHPSVEADNTFYLWRITPGYETVTYDDGSSDPVDRLYQLADYSGHQSIAFEICPSEAENVQVHMTPRPAELTNDNDALPVPPDAHEALLTLVQWHRLGDRDGDRAARVEFERRYREELDRLRAQFSGAKFSPRSMGDGLGIGPWPGGPFQILPVATLANP